MSQFKSSLSATDLVSNPSSFTVGGTKHAVLIDLISLLRSQNEEEMVRLLQGGHTQAEVLAALGVSQPTVSRMISNLSKRARLTDELEDAATQMFRDELASMGMTFREYCDKFNLMSPTLERKIRRFEAPVNESDKHDDHPRSKD